MSEHRPISVLVANERGVLARVAGLFARRGFNITSLAVGETEDIRFSRISVVIDGDDNTVEQVVKQLERLVCVKKVMGLGTAERIERGLALIKVKASPRTRPELIQLANIFRGRVDHVDSESLVIEATGRREKLQALIDLLRPHGIVEMARTGQIMLDRHSAMAPEIFAEPLPAEMVEGQNGAIYNLTRADQE